MSKKVALALAIQDKDETVGTRTFINMVDDFFDCLNVNNTFIGLMKRKEMLMPYEHPLDPRLQV